MEVCVSTRIVACSAIITRDADSQVYVGRRRLTKAGWPGLWETIGGGVEDDESPEACIVREIREELAAGVRTLSFFRDYSLDCGQVRVFIVSLEGVPRPNSADFEECRWMSEGEVVHQKFASNCRDRLMDYFRRQRREHHAEDVG
jgi:8-oxo-dGTP diphosphatase